MLLYQLTRPIAFRQIKHPALRIINVYAPGGLAVLVIFLFLLLPIKPKLFGDDSITSNALLFVTVLPGFFIAALAAVATFPSDSLNEIMPAPAPTLVMRTGDKLAPVELTSRIFLCHLFSYLTVLSFAGFLLGAGSDQLAPSALYFVSKLPSPEVSAFVMYLLHIGYIALLTWVFANLIVTTIYGLYFLVERIHRPYS
jgi:cytochrome c biogenesis factor